MGPPLLYKFVLGRLLDLIPILVRNSPGKLTIDNQNGWFTSFGTHASGINDAAPAYSGSWHLADSYGT
jgi:hypothetical protein